ncbi:MAG: arabinan endo-1,5-alpha-L-arabinosidase [Prolixibacteraceae bacterium]|nr:arabinan endo-1,5-alpha-L-arabinosidase [Prolixibacteraceae bacterium]
MKRFILFAVIILGLIVQQACAQSGQIIVHDPVAIEQNGKYYLYNTGEGISSWISDDLEHWTFLGKVFNEPPEWAKTQVPKFKGHIWAPDIIYRNGKYYLYYSISSFASNRSCIGVATNVTLNPDDDGYKWEDHGMVVQSVPGRDNWNAIDPNIAFDENNQPWMTFGSFWGGLKIVKLSSNMLSPAETQEWHTIAKRNRDKNLDETDPGNGAVEAPFIFKKGKYYYLFVSFDLCCRGSRSTYNVRVGRSEKITGPYYDREGVSMLEGGGTYIVGPNETFYGMGHNSVYRFKGKDYFFCHAYDKNHKGRPILVVELLDWDSKGWPTIHNK